MPRPEEPKRRALVLGNTALAVASTIESVVIAKGFELTVNGLVVKGSPSQKAWTGVGRDVRIMEKGSPLALGDWFNYGDERFGEEIWQEIDPGTGWSLKTLMNYGWIARRIAQDVRRMDRLGIRHHQLVAPLTPAKQRLWLTKAAADDEEKPWTVGRLKKALEEGEDLPVESWYVIVGPLASGQVQSDLMDRLEAEGLGVKAQERRKRKSAEPEAA